MGLKYQLQAKGSETTEYIVAELSPVIFFLFSRLKVFLTSMELVSVQILNAWMYLNSVVEATPSRSKRTSSQKPPLLVQGGLLL